MVLISYNNCLRLDTESEGDFQPSYFISWIDTVFRTARGAKLAQVKKAYASYGEQFEAVDVNDVAIDDVSAHLVGVDAVIHSAAPLSNRSDKEEIFNVHRLSSRR